MIPNITPTDLENAKTGIDILFWVGKHVKVWWDSRNEDEGKSKSKTATKKKSTRDVAIAVRISRMNVADVRSFLAARKTDADLVIISNSDTDEVVHLPNDPNVWEEIVSEYYTAFTKIQAEHGAKRFHVFLAAPAALAFAMGATMGTLYEVRLYQWDQEHHVYTEVIRGTSRERLMRSVKSKKR